MNKPNLFIIGAPKCGTTSLYHYLQGHPQIYMSPIKEPRFFSEDISARRAVETWKDYGKLFDGAGPEHIYVGEASPSYLRSHTAAKNIYAFNPEARILVMLRHPVEMLSAYHAELVYHFNEDVQNLENAWRLQELRREGQNIPERCRNPVALQYREVIHPAEQLQRWYEVFPPQQVKVMLLEDMKADARSLYLDLLSFLGLEDDGRTDFTPRNENRVWRDDRIGRLLMDPPPWLSRGARWYKKIFGQKDIAWKEKLRTGSSQVVPKAAVSESFRQELLEEYREEVVQLEQILGRSLTMWKH